MKAALFDLDGVIIDTEPSYSIFWGSVGEKYDVGVDDFANVIKGTTLTDILDRYFPDAQVRAQVISQLEDYENSMAYAIFPGVVSFLEQLKAARIPAAIVTSSNQEKMQHLWQQHPSLRRYFDAVITDELVSHSKPDPEPYLIAAKALGVDPADCCVFEDSFNGLISGRRAGCRVIALSTTNPSSSLSSLADLVIPSLSEYTE